ncbi:MAG: hypothetical protein COC19_00095 [SAR86 cluster bacterium]|uniref:Uncharacterized protein n=1 Tax=SAR86 cluster bacterium TaxID=2030880 RepID=A0A2A4MVX9_9GAMM|nr:MAG: hypothetical protein COC19_00095 [SAR86 cluster bacterium]
MLVENANEELNRDDPRVFNRGSLKLSYDLLRQTKPQLALQIRNITAGKVLINKSDVNNKHSDCFLVELDFLQIETIVAALSKRAQSDSTKDSDIGMILMAKTLLDDWHALAQYFADRSSHLKHRK